MSTIKHSFSGFLVLAIISLVFFSLSGCIATKRTPTGNVDPLDSIEELMQITITLSDEINPKISPNGKDLAFVADKTGDQDIFVSDLYGKNPLQVTVDPSLDNNPSWTNDGKSIYFDSNRLGYRAIYHKNLSKERITDAVVTRGTNDFFPDINKSNSYLVFENLTGGQETLWVLSLKNNSIFQIGEGGHPQWSPDGKNIVVHARKGGNNDIWLVEPTGKEIVQLTVDKAEDVEPAWSPDGQKIVFSSNRTGNYDIWMLNLKTNSLIQLTNNPADDGRPAWTPDGKYIYFHSTRSGNYDIWRIKPVL